MTPRPAGAEPVDDGLRAVRLTVLVFILLDVVATATGLAYEWPGLGPADVGPVAQGLVVLAAAAATMWDRPRPALGLSAAVVVLLLIAGPTGEEAWLLTVTAVVVAARARPGLVALAGLGQVGYAVVLGLNAEARQPGWGWPAGLATLGIAIAADGVGLVARRFLRARDGRRARIAALSREQAEIRAHERARLADDLQSVVTAGLAGIDHQVDAVAQGSRDVTELRDGLAQIETQSRRLLDELRLLLEVLRRDPGRDAEGPADVTDPARRWVGLLTARHVRIAASAVFGLLAAWAVPGSLGAEPDHGSLVQGLGLLAVAVAVWRPRVGAVTAVLTLAVSTMLGVPGYWDLLPLLLLGLLGAFHGGARRFWLLLPALAGYAVLVGLFDTTDSVDHVILAGLGALAVIITGLAARSFADVREDALRRLDDLAAERDRVPAEERRGAARELHDVVAHQLSLTTMLVMAAGPSEDPVVLADTLDRIRRRTRAAHHELATLLAALRGRDVAPAGPMPLVTPRVSAHALAERLVEHGHHPVLDLDAAADELDPTTQRTLSRVLQESTTNLLRYAPAGSTCHFGLAADAAGVRLTVASPLAATPRTSDLSLGWGLRGLRERVDLSQGTFAAGPDGDGRWVVAVTLPAAAAPVNPGAHATRT